MSPDQRILTYIRIDSIGACIRKVERLGDRVILPKTQVPKSDTWRSAPIPKEIHLVSGRTTLKHNRNPGTQMLGATLTIPGRPMVKREQPFRILGIQGSPRGSKSRTRKLVQYALSGAAEQGVAIEMIDLADRRIEPCTACDDCALTGLCVFDDDFPQISDEMRSSDGIILGSPCILTTLPGR